MISKKTLLVSLVSLSLLFRLAGECLADAAAQHTQAEACENNKDYNCAETIYKDIVQNYPGSNEALAAQRDLIGLYIDMGNDAGAQQALDKLIVDFSGHSGLPGALSYVATRYRWASKYEEATSIYQQIIQQYPGSSYAEMAQFEFPKMNVLSLIESGIKSGDDAAGQAALESLIADFQGHPGLPEVLYEVTRIYRKSRLYEKAKSLHQLIVTNYPDSDYLISAHKSLIIIDIGEGNIAAAKAAIGKLTSDFSGHPLLPDVLYSIANGYEYGGYYYEGPVKLEEAKNIYQQIAQQHPDNPYAGKAQLEIAKLNVLLLIKDGNDIETQPAIDKLISDFDDHPDSPKAVSEIAEQYYYKAHEDPNKCRKVTSEAYLVKANDIWERIIAQWPQSQSLGLKHAYYFSAVCYFRFGEYEKAIEYYQKVVSDWPDYVYAWSAQCLIAECYDKLRKSGGLPESEANPMIEQAYLAVLENYSDSSLAPHACLKLGQLSLRRNQPPEAIFYFELFLELANPDDPHIEWVITQLEELKKE